MKTIEKFSQQEFEGKKEVENKTEKGYIFEEEMKELEGLMIPLVEKLKSRIDNNEYDALISDDASGRLPTLILRKIIQAKIKENNLGMTSEQDRKSLKTWFVAGGQDNSDNKELYEFFKKIRPSIKKRALLVTEFISTGKSITRLINFLGKVNIDFDIAAASAKENLRYYHKYGFMNQLNQELFIGEERIGAPPNIYARYDLTGTIRDEEGGRAHPEIIFNKGQRNINVARSDVSIMADRILKKVWGKK